ncbi:MAG TPA: hypothetical protein VLH35_05880 [Candidatus Acidoferrales bacterium]|nr:hypothetical protein [Candidatus Acidoferrales bacterium]
MSWEETQTFIQSGHKSPNEFQQNTLKTVELHEKAGIQAIIGKPKGKPTMEIQSYIFRKDKGWTKQDAQAWYNKLNLFVKVPVETEVVESLSKKTVESSIPLSQAIRMIEEVLPNNMVQRSWSLGPQRMCQELNRILYRLHSMEANQGHKLSVIDLEESF